MLEYRYYPLRLQNLIAVSSLPVTSNASLQVTRYAFVKLNLSIDRRITPRPIDHFRRECLDRHIDGIVLLVKPGAHEQKERATVNRALVPTVYN